MLGQDTTASEKLMGPFVLVASFLMITIMVLASMTAFLQTAGGQWDEVRGTLMVGTTDYTLREPVDGWNIDDDNVTDRWDHEASENAYFYEDEPGEDDQIVVGFIRGNVYFDEWAVVGVGDMSVSYGVDRSLYYDFVMVYTEFGWWSQDDWPISYETIIANRMGDSNVSVTEFGIRHNTTYALIVETGGPGDLFEVMVWANTFNLKIGLPDYGEDIASASMWTILGQVMTASIPEVSFEVNLIIGATLYAGVGMIVFTVISRMIPFVAGG